MPTRQVSIFDGIQAMHRKHEAFRSNHVTTQHPSQGLIDEADTSPSLPVVSPPEVPSKTAAVTNVANQACGNGVFKGLDKVLAKKKRRMRWNLQDKRLILKVCGKIKKRCDVVRHLRDNWRYLGRYQNIRESTIRTIQKQAIHVLQGDGPNAKRGRRTILSDETMEKIKARIRKCI